MPEKKSIRQELIDAGFNTNYNSRLKTISPAAQGLADSASILNLNTNLEKQRLYQESLVEKQSSGIANILEKSYLIDNKDALLSIEGNKDLALLKPSFSQVMSDDLFSVSAKGTEINLDKISLDSNTKQSFTSVANVLNKKLNQGDLKALEEVNGYFQKAFNSGMLSKEAKNKLSEEYTDIANFFKNKKVYGLAENKFNILLESTNDQQKNDFLKSITQNNVNQNNAKFIYNIGLNSEQEKDELVKTMLDANSYIPGSFVYNKENLNAVKSTPLGTSPIFSSQGFYRLANATPFTTSIGLAIAGESQKEYVKELANIDHDYVNLMGIAVKNKQSELKNQLSKVDEGLKANANDQNLLNQKNKLQKDLSFTQEVSKKLDPLENKKNFYKNFYPGLYQEEVKKEKSEIAYNDLAMSSGYEHPLRKAKSIAYRSVQQIGANTVNQLSGISALFGGYSASLGLNLASKGIAPPSYRRVNDLNKNSLVEPNEVIKDRNGDPIYVSNVIWTDEKGKSHWNLSAATEQTLPIAVDIAETLLLSRGAGLLARGAGVTWANMGRAAKLSAEAQKTFLTQVAPKISTFGNVYATTFPRFYAEERNNFKNENDAIKVSTARATIEALTETVVPDTEFFKGGRSFGALDGVFKKLGKYDPTDFSKFTMKRDVLLGLLPDNSMSALKASMLVAPSAIRKTLSGALQETLEEELSLLGNYFVDKYAGSKDFTVEQTNELTYDNALETFISGFIPSLFISGIPASLNAKSRRDQARWDIANNSDQYVAFINKQVQDGKITKDDAIKKTAVINRLKDNLSSMEDISQIKDLSNLLDDKELQFQYFNARLYQEDLLSVDTSTFTEEQLAQYQKQLDDSSNVIIDARKRVEKYNNLTEDDKKKIITGVFEKQSKKATDPNQSLSALLNTLYSTAGATSQVAKDDTRKDLIDELYDKFILDVETTIDDRLAGFQTLLEESPEKLTTLELQIAKNQFIPFLQQYKGSKRRDVTQTPFTVREQGPQPKQFFEEYLIDLIKTELSTRSVPTEEEYIEQAKVNFKNPETKDFQNTQMIASELSEEELESGQLSENAHSHLTDGQRLILGDLLEKHKAQKEEDPSTKSSLEKIIENAELYYRGIIKGLSPEEALAKKKEVNKSIVDSVFGNVQEQEKQIEKELKDQSEGKKAEEKKEEVKPKENQIEKIKKSIINKLKKFLSPTYNPSSTVSELQGMLSDIVKNLPNILENQSDVIELINILSVIIQNQYVDNSFISKQEQLALNSILNRLEIKGYKVAEMLGNEYVEGMNVTANFIPSNNENSKTGKKIITRVIKPQVNFNGKMIQSAQIEVTLDYDDKYDGKSKSSKEESSKYERGFTPESSKEEKEEVEQTRKVDQDIFNQFRETRIEANNSIEDAVAGEETEEDKKIERAKQNNQLFSSFSEYTIDPENYGNNFSNLESAMLGFFLEDGKQKKIIKFFDTVEKNNSDFSLLKGVISEDYMEEFSLAVNAMLSNSTVEEQVESEKEEEQGENITEDEKSESEIQENNVNEKDTSDINDKENEKETQPEVGNFVELNIVELKKDDTPVEDSTVTRNLNIVQILDNELRKNSNLQVYSLIQTPLNTFKKILSPERYNLLEQLVNKKSLTEQQKSELKNILTYNRMSILDEGMLNYILNNPSSLTLPNTSLSVVVDQDNNPVYFNSDGQIGTAETGVPLVTSIKKTGVGSSIGNSISTGPVRAKMTGTSSTSKALPLGSVKSSSSIIYVHLDATTSRVSPFGNTYTLETGGVYLQNNEAVYPYNRIDLTQIEGKNLYSLVQAFNEGTLPEGFPTDATEFLTLIGNNFYSDRKTENLRFFPQGKFYIAKLRDKNQLSIKSQNDEGKAVTVGKGTQEKLVEGVKVRKAFWANLLKTNTSFDAIIFDKEGKPSIKNFNSYSDYILSSEFGATVTKEWQKTLRFEAPLPVTLTTTEVQSSVAAVEENTVDELGKPAPVSDVEPKEAPKKKRRSALERLNSQIANEKDPEGPDFKGLKRARTLSNKITKEQNEAAKAWVNNHPIFKNTSFIFNETVKNPAAYAVWSKAGIQLFQGANYAEAYHEAWHEFSQLYLTSEQKEKLYAEAKKIWGDIPFVELEEKIAESFRTYALTGGQTLPKEISKYKETKSIFQSIWDFLTNLFSEKKTIDKYFGQLYKGNISQYTRKESNQYFKELFSSKLVVTDLEGNTRPLSFVESQKVIDEVDGLFVTVANEVLKPHNASVINVLLNPEYVKTVYAQVVKYYKNVYQEEYEILLENDENGIEDLQQEQLLDYIGETIQNLPNILQYHKNNSSLFDNKVKKSNIENTLNDILENSENEGIGSFEQSIEENSQQDLASDVIINAIRTLPRYQNGEVVTHPTLGFSLLGDFNENWTILQRTLSGSNTYEDMYSKLKELSKKFPQFKTLLTYLKAPNESITRITDLSFKSQFFNLFTMPYMDGSTVKITRNEKGDITETRVLKALSLDAVQLRSQLDNDFNFESGQFKTLSNNGSYSLDTDTFFTTFPEVPSIPAADPQALRNWYDQIFLQLDALGISYSSLGIEALRQEKPETLARNLNLIRTKLASLAKTEEPLFTPLTAISKEHTLDEKKVKSENTAVAYFLGIEIEANPSYANDMRYNAVGKQIWSVNQHTYMTKIVSVLNDANLYPTLDDVVKQFPHLNYSSNTNARGSWVLQYLFNTAGKRITENGQLRKIDIVNLLGIEDGFDGEKTIDTINSVKHFADVTGLLNGGVEEINRLSGKSTTRGVGLDLSARQYLGLANTENNALSFVKDDKAYLPYKEVFGRFILPILKSEIDTFNNKVNNQVFKVKMGETPSLAYFQEIIESESLRSRLVEDLKDVSLDKLSETFLALPYAKDVYLAFNEYINTSATLSQDILQGYPLSFEQLAKYHTYSFIMRVEQHKLFFNHPFYYKNEKDIEKRLSAWNAYGSYSLLDNANVNAVYNLSNAVNAQEKAYQEYALENNIPIIARTKDPRKVSYLVFNDTVVFSETAKSSKAYDSVRDAYVGNKDSKAQDAASVATLDFFRKFYATSTGITVEMEQEFERQNKIWSTYLKLKSASSFETPLLQRELDNLLNEKPAHKFNIKKLQYAGNNPSVFGPTIPIFHKYSVKPLLPSEAVLNSRVADIMEKLYASGADYGVFTSGTKISETIPAVDLFDKDGKVDKSAQVTGNIDFNYLKEQVIVENKESFLTIFSSQLRKLIYKDINNVNEQELYDAYALYMKNLVEYDSELFLEKLDNKEKLVEFILGELSRKGAAQATKDLIQIKEDGKLKYLLDSLIDRTVMESAIVSSVKNKVIRQKVNGAQRVQFPVSLMSDRKLKYYDLKNGKVTKAETMISFSKLYYPLLNLEYEGRPIGELNSKGEPIDPHSALKRLNEALNDSEFKAKHQRQITISAIRIPGQGYNSMENFEIVEFLPEESGDIILVPDEMVVKSGSDFDIDKLFCYDPYIEKDGSTETNNLTSKEAIARKKQLTADYDNKRAELQDYIEEKTKVLAELDEFLKSKNISSVSEVYKELKALKAEVADNDAEFNEEVDLNQMLLDKFKNGLSREEILNKNLKGREKTKFDERKNKIKQLSSILSAYSTSKFGFYLSEANQAINETRTELEEIKNKLKSIRGKMSNSILFNISDRLTQEEIFEDLITPNSTSEIDKAADPLVKSKSKWATASYTNIVNPIYQLYVFSLNSYKKSLGTDAKNNVLHSILQKAKIHIVDEKSNLRYVLPANRTEDGKLTFEKDRDTSGQKISLVQGQMISAHVDIEKDDRIALLNFNNVVTPIVNYMTMLGTPFKNIVDLINNRPSANKESAIAKFSKNPDFDSMYNYFSKYDDTQVKKILKLSLTDKGTFSKKKFISASIGYLVNNTNQESIDAILNEQSEYGDLIRFSLFMELKDQADKVRILSANTDFDTFSPQNFESLRRTDSELVALKKDKFFDEEGFEKVLNESIVSPFQVQSTILDKFEEIFPVSANKTVTDGIVISFGQLSKKNRFLNYESFSRTFKNDFLFSMYVNEVPNVISYETLLDKTNPNNLKAQYESLKKRFAEKNIDSDNRIFNLVRFNTDEKSKYFRTGLRQNTFDYSVDYYREEFENGLNYSHPNLDPVTDAQLIDDFKSFMEGFAYAGILGSQLNKKFDSYLSIIPEQIYTYPMNSVLENFQALSQEEQKAKLSTFYKRFLSNHPEFVRQKDVNPDLRYYKDYVLSRESITPTTPTGKSITAVDDLPDEDEGNVNDVVETTTETNQPIVEPTLPLESFDSEVNQAAQDSFMALRNRNKNLKDNC